jgi:hypothetical protein
MNEHDDAQETDDEVMVLLPWYATGRLPEDERALVERRLAADPALRRQLELIEEERAATVESNASLPAPSRASLDALMAEVEAQTPAGGMRRLPAAWLERAGAWLDGFSPRLRAAAAAAALAVVITQSAMIGHLLQDDDAATFVTVTEPDAPVDGRGTLLVAFAPDAPASAVTAILQEMDAAIVDGPRADGIFVLRLPGDVDAAQTAEMLRGRQDVISFVLEGG